MRPKGLAKFAEGLIKSAGLVAGILFFFLSVFFFQARVLDIRVVGSGAYYKDEVLRILNENGIKKLSALPKDLAAVTSSIVSLPRVGFCTVDKDGGIVTVTVEVTDDDGALVSEPLLSPATGTVDELVVVRGTPLFAVGDSVKEGDALVQNEVFFGEEQEEPNRVIVIARVVVAVQFTREYACGEEGALLNVELEFGATRDLHITKTGKGVLVEGTALIAGSLNLK